MTSIDPVALRAALAERMIVADGAMGTMLQASAAALSDFDGHEGCNEILNVTRPDIVRAVHDGYLELHGLSVQLAEALAEYWHARVRDELGLAGFDPPGPDSILKVGYRGCRYSFGYPACPNLEDRATVARLLHPERIGVALSEECQLVPEQSTDALITQHPEARYFST